MTENQTPPGGVSQKPTSIALGELSDAAWQPILSHSACAASVQYALSKALIDLAGVSPQNLTIEVGLTSATTVTMERTKGGIVTYRIDLRPGVTLLNYTLAFRHDEPSEFVQVADHADNERTWELMGDDDLDMGPLEVVVSLQVTGADLFAEQGEERIWCRNHGQR